MFARPVYFAAGLWSYLSAVASGGQKQNGPAKLPGSIDLDAPYPSTNPTVAPIPPDPEFAEEISEDLLEDAAEALKLVQPVTPVPTPEKGISLEDIGVQMQIQTKHTTQKIYIEELPATDQDETVVDLKEQLADDDDEQPTESIDRKIVEEAQRVRRVVPDRTPTLHDEDETNDV